ncbi:protein takeout-like [Neocloeon triangulifer]|uniref:protein takeout-like n=1 Tax=Neocloeon triangulifer TaxID=2078957 RepID=UPI00286EE913|nr:protein takeout-like [Neocloeon triangulifer]
MEAGKICRAVLLFLSVIFSTTHAAKLKIGDFAQACRADGPELNECVRQAMLKVIPKMAKGVRDLGLIPFDPLKVPKVVIDQRGNGPVGLQLTFVNSEHVGVSKLAPHTVRVVPERMYFEINSTLPNYRIIGDYEVTGRILLLPLIGNGPSNFSMNDLQLNWVFFGKPEVRNNKTYCRLTDCRIRMRIGSGFMNLENLFNGDKRLGDNMNRILNDNFLEVIKEVQPALEETFSQLYLKLISPIFASVKYEDVFPGIDLSKVRAGSYDV